MSGSNGTHTKHSVLVIGGDARNIPKWARAAFSIEHVYAETGSGNGKLSVKGSPEAIVVITDHVSHNFSDQAISLGRDLKIPVLKARSGWATAVANAAKHRIDWFVDAVQVASEKDAEHPAAEIIDNAWKATAEYERERCEALSDRLKEVQARLLKAEEVAARAKGAAQQRVLAEVARRANEVRKRHTDLIEPVAEEVALLKLGLGRITERLAAIEQRLRGELE